MASPTNDKTERRRWRKKLRSWGMDEAEITLCMEQVKQRQQMKATGRLPLDAPLCTRAEYARMLRRKGVQPGSAHVLRLGDDFEAPDAKGYQPARVDPVLTGVARATGATAKAVKAGKTITKYQHDERTE